MPIDADDPEFDEAYNRGWSDFPGGRMADALRGTKSAPDRPRCPYRRADRILGWETGIAHAEAAFFAAQ